MNFSKDPLTLYAPAKLNLTCDVIRRREDGYHDLDMLNIRVSLYDELEFSLGCKTEITYEGMPVPENDIVRKAIAVYSEITGLDIQARVHVRKRIPSEAGLGGGSADGAAVLLALHRAYQKPDFALLEQAALRVGADVPYCLYDIPCRVQGIGEQLTPVDMPDKALWFLILKPARGISTGVLFASLSFPVSHPRTEAAETALRAADATALGPQLFNAMQVAAQALLPEIGTLTARLKQSGALGAVMTGSGSAVFGLFASKTAAEEAALCFGDVPFSCVCRSLPLGLGHNAER